MLASCVTLFLWDRLESAWKPIATLEAVQLEECGLELDNLPSSGVGEEHVF